MAGAAGSWEAGSSQAIKTSARAPRAADSSSHDGDCATSKDSQHMGLQVIQCPPLSSVLFSLATEWTLDIRWTDQWRLLI